MTESERMTYEKYQMNKMIVEGVLQVREKKGRQQIINGMKASGMTDEQIENVLKLSEEK